MALGVDCRGRCRWSRTWRYLESLDFHGDIGISRFRTIHASANPRSCTSWKPRALPETLGRERGPQTLSSACHLRTRRGPEALSVSLCLSLSLSQSQKRKELQLASRQTVETQASTGAKRWSCPGEHDNCRLLWSPSCRPRCVRASAPPRGLRAMWGSCCDIPLPG